MVPQTKVFVGSLPQGSSPEELRKLFERFGVVTECDIMNRCGFVHMQTEEQASTAIRSLHNSTFNGSVISVERGRIKERGARGGGGGGRGGRGRGGERHGGGPMRGGPPSGRDAPYAREPRMHLRQIPGAGSMPMQGRGGYERGQRQTPGGYEDRYGGGYGEDRRGFALMDSHDPYAAPAPLYDDRRSYAAQGGYEEMPMYSESHERHMPMYEEMERRGPPRVMGGPAPYDRAVPRHHQHMGNGDMFSRRSPMRGGAPAPGGYERDPYSQTYSPMGRWGGSPARSGAPGLRRY